MTKYDVKRVRTKLRLTQDGLADLLGVARNTVARWELGLHPVSSPVERLLITLAASFSKPDKPGKTRRRNG